MIKEALLRLIQHFLSIFIFDLPPLFYFKKGIYKVLFKIGAKTYVAYNSFLLNPHFNKKAYLEIGKNTGIENGCHIDYSGGVKIGSNVWISENVFITTHEHDVKTNELKKKQKTYFSELEIGDDAWLGVNCIILPKVKKIGEGAIIGAASVVTKNIPDFAIVVGNPSKIINYRKKIEK